MKMNPQSTEWNSSSEGLMMSITPTSSARTADRTVSAHNLSSRKGKNPGSTHSSSNEEPFSDTCTGSGELPVNNHLAETSPGSNTGDLSTEMTSGQPTQDYASSSRGSSSSSSSKKIHHYHHHHSTDLEVTVQDNTNYNDETQNKESRRSSKHTRTTRPSKYKDTDVKRMESSRRRSRSRSQDRSRRSSGSQDPSRQRRSKSRDATETSKRRSRSQDPLATAQQRLDERRRSRSQDPNEEGKKFVVGGEEETATRPVRQGRRPTRPTRGIVESTSTSSRTATTTTLPTTLSPLPMETTTILPDPILQQYLGEGTRAFDYILGLEPPTTTDTHSLPGHKSMERTGTPVSNAILSLASPQIPKKSFEPTNNPHVSPTIFFNSMAKKVAGDRWLQDESIRSRRSSDPASPRKSLGDQLLALGRDSFNANTLDPDEKSMHSQDLTPQVPRRRGSKRLAGTRPKPAEPPFTSDSDMISNDGSSINNNSQCHSVSKSPHKQIRKLANKVVKTSKSMLQGESNNIKTPPSSTTNRNVSAPSHQPLNDKVSDHAGLDDPSSDSKSSSSSWLVHEDGALTPRTLKRRSTLQKARDKVTTLLKTNKKPSQKPELWGALEDSDSVEISDVDEEDFEKGILDPPLQPFSVASLQFDVKRPLQDVNLVRETNPSPPPPLPSPPLLHNDCAPTPSRRIKSKAASEEAEEHDIMPSDPEKHPLRKSSTRKPRRSSSPSRRTRSSSPNSSRSNHTSSTVRRKSRSIQEKHDSRSRTSSSSNGRRSQSLTKHEESVGGTTTSGGSEEGPTSQERRRRSRSESRPESHVGTSRDESHGDSRRSKTQTRPSSSREVTRSNSPHSLRSAAISIKERKPRPMSNSPGNYRREGSKRREALQKIRSERSVKSLNLAETTTSSTTTSDTIEHSDSTNTGLVNDNGNTLKGARRQNTSSRSVISGDARASSVRSMDPNMMRDFDKKESIRNDKRRTKGEVDKSKGLKDGASDATLSFGESVAT